MNIIQAREALLKGDRIVHSNHIGCDEAIINDKNQMEWKNSGIVIPIHPYNIEGWKIIKEPKKKYIDCGIYAARDIYAFLYGSNQFDLIDAPNIIGFEGYVYEGGYVLNVPVAYKQHSNRMHTADFSPRKTDQHYVVAKPIAVRFKK